MHSKIYFLSIVTGKEEKLPTVPQFTIIIFSGNPLLRDDKGDRLNHGEISLQNGIFLKAINKCLKGENM